MIEDTSDGQANATRSAEELMISIYKGFIATNFNIDTITTAKLHELIEGDDFKGSDSYEVSTKVLERLLMRHSILKSMEVIEGSYTASQKYVPRKRRLVVPAPEKRAASVSGAARTVSSCHVYCDEKRAASESSTAESTSTEKVEAADTPPSPPLVGDNPSSDCTVFDEFKFNDESENKNRIYRLAATDLFVEKAIAYLERDSVEYIKKGGLLFRIALGSIIFGIFASAITFGLDLYKSTQQKGLSFSILGHQILSSQSGSWFEFFSSFVKAFTFYGFVVLFAVFCIRLGKALMDQAERLRERRHSLRQGRLYIHLSNGEVTVEELEKAFDWNVSKGNAFGNIPTEASAPWGAVIKEALKAFPEAFKKVKGAVKD